MTAILRVGESNTIRIGDNLPTGGQSNCYIGGINSESCDPDSCFIVGADINNKLGTNTGPHLLLKDLFEDHKKVAELEAAVAALSAQLREQAAQIQKVSAQIQMTKPTTKVVLNNP